MINQWSCTITEKAPTRAFSWLKAPTTFKTLLTPSYWWVDISTWTPPPQNWYISDTVHKIWTNLFWMHLHYSYPIYARSGHNFNSHLLMACLAPLSIIALCWTPSVHARTPCAGSIYQMRLLIGCSQFGSYSRLLIGCSEIGSCSICQSGQLIWTEVIDVI